MAVTKEQKKLAALEELFDDNLMDNIEVIPTGVAMVDPALGGGIPEGVLGEVFGPTGSGKTSLMYCHIAQHQKRGNVSILMDAEGSWNPNMGARYGIDVNHVNEAGQKTFRKMSDSGVLIAEQLLSRIKTILYGMPEVRFILVDSMAALSTEKQAEREDGEQGNTDAMQRAKVMYSGTKDIRRWIEDTGCKCSVVFINHEQEVIEMDNRAQRGPKKVTTPGGRGLKFFSTFRLRFEELTQKDRVKVYDPVTGYDVSKVDKVYIRVTAIKNRIATPFVPATFIFDVGGGTGIDTVSTGFAHAVAQKVLKKKGAMYTLPAEYTTEEKDLSLKGKEAVKQYYRDNPEPFGRLESHLAANLMKSREVFVSHEGEDEEDDDLTLESIKA